MKIEGTVVQGKQLGRTLGFPTANLLPDGEWQLVRAGVWAAWFHLDGQCHPCMVNIGRHPTLPEGPATIEAHIFDYSGELYGRRAQLETVAFLREETRFADVQALRAQLERDKIQARHILASQRID